MQTLTAASAVSSVPASPHIGIFDSGVGGLSVLRALHAELPAARLSYIADSAHAPYGERDVAHILERSRRVARALIDAGAQLLVVACNTATAAAVDALRADWPALPIVGVEPGIKPAVALSNVGRVGVLATPATVASERFQRLVAAHSARCDILAVPCPGLAARIEQGHLDDPALAEEIAALCAPLVARQVDVVALGCTHYPFVGAQIGQALGAGVVLVDTAEAVARQATRLAADLGRADESAVVRLCSNGDVALLGRLAALWLPFPVTVDAAPGSLD